MFRIPVVQVVLPAVLLFGVEGARAQSTIVPRRPTRMAGWGCKPRNLRGAAHTGG